ncbi:probable cinnamyl alcohol dehydrogenase 5 [Oryza brachyantha]|uniref:probable cinnamyl alcohol dehydrogenase 5 n=1 Tax=Oryza brachyantha TaxID=4533 RepID=UPI001AD999F4|nr:probable cinnamyl alcohol dehydrogenase 5 [Oryza brachyantha]
MARLTRGGIRSKKRWHMHVGGGAGGIPEAFWVENLTEKVHEITGVVTEVGKNVARFKAGDRVGVGSIVDSCQSCESCHRAFENHCTGGIVFTYNSVDRGGAVTYGGYSTTVVVRERIVVGFPESMPLDDGAPLLCAGITVYSPMKHHGLNVPGKHVGVLGLGGLGHVAVKFAKAFGVKVTVISSSPGKKEEALGRLGADAFVVSSNADEMKAATSSMDGILSTASANIPMAPLFRLLKPNGKLILLGLPEMPLEVAPFDLIIGSKTLAGSSFGGMADTQEMIDFAANHGVTADVEVIGADYVNTAMESLAKSDVRYRFVIDVGNTIHDGGAATEVTAADSTASPSPSPKPTAGHEHHASGTCLTKKSSYKPAFSAVTTVHQSSFKIQAKLTTLDKPFLYHCNIAANITKQFSSSSGTAAHDSNAWAS